MKYWEILLTKQRERGKDGLTIPFIIGSQQYLSTSSNQDISELILDMAGNYSFETCIRYCIGTQTLIAEIRNPGNNVYYLETNNGEKTNLSIGVLILDDIGINLQDAIEKFVEKFKAPIDRLTFSAEPNVDSREVNWQAFTEEDIKFVEDSFSSLSNSLCCKD
ncbi:hypothetical protein DSL64_02920 [Dyadobacter luteus]|uniref:Uncharacterized protein n=1 Tax=Dyadobacter luteus TaxID=2259619 RepID=A0A3D8YFG3_9BACT|nr:hypothetical protein [Dyadobacter luteus]REA63415.1 hypothetical protein DSL64_02920 [Dyadobacter luteus]